MEQLVDRHAAASVFAIPGQIVADLALKKDFAFSRLLENEQCSELLGDGSDVEASVRRVGSASLHVGVADSLFVNDLALVCDENRAIEIPEPLVVGNDQADALSLVDRRRLARERDGREPKKQGQKGSELAGHGGKDTNPAG